MEKNQIILNCFFLNHPPYVKYKDLFRMQQNIKSNKIKCLNSIWNNF